MESTRELLAGAAEQLAAAGVPTPEVDAELLLAHVTGRPRALLRMAGGTVTDEQSSEFAALVAQRAQRIPLQHLTGLAPFRHLELRVGPGVFIPRPETELMVDHVLGFAAERRRSVRGTMPDPATGPPTSASRRGSRAPRRARACWSSTSARARRRWRCRSRPSCRAAG